MKYEIHEMLLYEFRSNENGIRNTVCEGIRNPQSWNSEVKYPKSIESESGIPCRSRFPYTSRKAILIFFFDALKPGSHVRHKHKHKNIRKRR
jgi:hypothetical protein